MSDPYDADNQFRVQHLVYDTVIAHADAIRVLRAHKFLAAHRHWFLGEVFHSRHYARNSLPINGP